MLTHLQHEFPFKIYVENIMNSLQYSIYPNVLERERQESATNGGCISIDLFQFTVSQRVSVTYYVTVTFNKHHYNCQNFGTFISF